MKNSWMNVLRTAAVLGIAFAGVAACGSPSKAEPNLVRVKIETNAGNIVVELDRKHAPKTVENFLHYVDKHFYTGGTFFRAVPGFMIQGGNRAHAKLTDPKVDLEPPIMTGLRNKDGAISMARTSDPNSATSEFFICDGDQAHLDGSMTQPGYAVFGHVVSGMDVVRKIAHMDTNGEMLKTPVKIIKILRLADPPAAT